MKLCKFLHTCADSRLRPPIIVAIAVGASVVFLLVVLVLWLYLRPHKKMPTEVPTEISEDPPKESRTGMSLDMWHQ